MLFINNQLATPENYQVRWYVLKDQDDGWHVDGVMTATTKEMTITKTFRNLDQSQVQQILSNGYEVDMKIGNGTYMYLKTDGDLNGQYTYSSSYDDTTKAYTCIWRVRVLDGEKYVIQEKNYDSDSAWSIPDPVTYCLLCAGLAGDKDTSAKGEKISDGTCDLRSFLGNSVRAAFAFANADQKRQ